MAYEYITEYTSPNQSPRALNIQSITIHWWGDPAAGYSFSGTVNHLCNPNTDVSAHYVAEAGRVACLVDCNKAAWHAGTYRGNHSSIGIECNPRTSAGDLETVAQLIADIRSVYGALPLLPHHHWVNTACPGTYTAQLEWLNRRACQLHASCKPKAPSNPAPAAQLIAVDGYWGPATTRAMQRINGTPADGIVSGQSSHMRPYLPAAASGWEWSAQPEGSLLISRMQKAFKATQDGIMGPESVRAMQRYYHVGQDGIMGPATVRAMQTAINRQLSRA